MIRVPALRADQEIVDLGLDDLLAQRLEFELLPTAIAHGDAVLTGGKPVTHLGISPTDKHLPGHEPDRGFLPILVRSQLPSLFVLGLERVHAL